MKTILEIEEAIDLMRKINFETLHFYMNKKTHESILAEVNFKPESIVLNEIIEFGTVLVLKQNQIDEMNKTYLPDKGPWWCHE